MAKKALSQPDNQESTELALFPKLNLPTVTHITEEMNASFQTMYTRLEADIANLPMDMTDPKNRAAVASYAYRISRTKTALDDAAQGVSSEAKTIVDAVNAERRELKTTLDILRDKARARLDAWEAAEADKRGRYALEEGALDGMVARVTLSGMASGEIYDVMAKLENTFFREEDVGSEWEALETLKRSVMRELQEMAVRKVREEQEAAELAIFRREKVEREAAEAARIAEDKRKAEEEAEAARQEAQRVRIAQEAEEKAKRDAAEAIENAKREQAAAEQRAIDAENQRIKDAEAAERRQVEAEEARKEAAARAEEQARIREETAKREERERINREEQARIKADQERAADIAHRKRFNSDAVAALLKTTDLTEKQAQAVIIAVYKDQVPHVSINY